MKHAPAAANISGPPMPPTRGHDLKRSDPCAAWLAGRMPPTRGHDLKLT